MKQLLLIQGLWFVVLERIQETFYAKVYRSASPEKILSTLFHTNRDGVESSFGFVPGGHISSCNRFNWNS